MKPLARRIERQFQKNLEQQIFVNELRIKVQQMKECFTGDTLPCPRAEVIAAWNDLPNITINIVPASIKTGVIFLRAPPPTPTDLGFDTDDTMSDAASLGDSPNDGWLLVDDTGSPMPDVAASQNPEPSVASEGDSMSMSRCSDPDQSLNGQVHEGDSFQSTDRGSPASDHERLSSSSRSSSTPVGFQDVANQWLLDYRARGSELFIESLIAFGVASIETAPLASRIGRDISKKVAKTSYMEGKNLEDTIRFTALTTFKKCWGSDDTLMEVPYTREDSLSSTPYGLDIASFMGSLFDAGIFSAKDIHLCLSLLLGGEKRVDCLCAMHALLVHANDKLCKNRNLPALMRFQHEITSREAETGEYVWGTSPRAKAVMADIIAVIERWLVSQALKRDQFRTSPGNRRKVKQRAIGPRVRTETVEPRIA